MFEGCESLTDIKGLENWNVSNGNNCEGMFDGFKWNISHENYFLHITFGECKLLSDIKGSQIYTVLNTKDNVIPVLLCFFEIGNEEQKQYCFNLKDNFKNEKVIRYEIRSFLGIKFSIFFLLNRKAHEIQSNFENSNHAMNSSL